MVPLVYWMLIGSSKLVRTGVVQSIGGDAGADDVCPRSMPRRGSPGDHHPSWQKREFQRPGCGTNFRRDALQNLVVVCRLEHVGQDQMAAARPQFSAYSGSSLMPDDARSRRLLVANASAPFGTFVDQMRPSPSTSDH